jgi:hypothetical protein
MKRIRTAIQRILQNDLPRTPTGRWNLDYCNRKLNSKIELSNEDHCGSCGQYAITKNEFNKLNELKNKNISAENDKNL